MVPLTITASRKFFEKGVATIKKGGRIAVSEKPTITNMITDAAVSEAIATMGYDLTDFDITEEDGVRSITIGMTSGDDDEAWMDDLEKALPEGAEASWDGNSNTDKYGDTTEDVTIAWRVKNAE